MITKHKRSPRFSWDFERPNELPIVVESDDPRHPVIAKFYDDAGAIDRARALIDDLVAGRADYRKLAKEWETP